MTAWTIWRDSVCAGDDGDAPHEITVDAAPDASVGQFAAQLTSQRYLASIAGGKATWVLEGLRPVAVFAQQWAAPKFLSAPETRVSAVVAPGGRPHFNFRYLCQVDPQEVFDGLAPR